MTAEIRWWKDGTRIMRMRREPDGKLYLADFTLEGRVINPEWLAYNYVIEWCGWPDTWDTRCTTHRIRPPWGDVLLVFEDLSSDPAGAGS